MILSACFIVAVLQTGLQYAMGVKMLEQLKEMICEYVEVEPSEIKEESRFIEDLGFNSYDFMSMIGEIEDTFEIEVVEREVVNVKTVGDAVKYIKELQEA